MRSVEVFSFQGSYNGIGRRGDDMGTAGGASSAMGAASQPGRQAGGQTLRWRRVFDGDEAQVPEVRHWLAGLLPGCPSRDDVVSVACELCSNAITHTASGRGGFFAVEIAWQDAIVRVSVADAGAPTGPRRRLADPMADRGRGLVIVQTLCTRTGVCGDHRGRLAWGELLWDGPPAAATQGHEAAISDDLTRLAHRHQGVPVWFGHSTLTWWALTGQPGHGRLVSAPTALELGDVIESSQAPRRMPGPDAGAARADRRARPATLPGPARSHPPRTGLPPTPSVKCCPKPAPPPGRTAASTSARPSGWPARASRSSSTSAVACRPP
jgi:hypothetical protein